MKPLIDQKVLGLTREKPGQEAVGMPLSVRGPSDDFAFDTVNLSSSPATKGREGCDLEPLSQSVGFGTSLYRFA